MTTKSKSAIVILRKAERGVTRMEKETKKSLFTCRVESGLLQEFNEICDELGMNASSAVTAFMRKTVREKAIPFDVVVDQQKKDKADVDRAVYYMKKLKELDNQ